MTPNTADHRQHDPDHHKALSFDQAADLYDRVRPRYPVALFDAMVELADLRPGD